MSAKKTEKGEAVRIDNLDIQDLAAYILGLDFEKVDHREIEDKLVETFGCSMDAFQDIVSRLVPLANTGKIPLTGQVYQGFIHPKDLYWIVKHDVEPPEKK